MLGRVVKDIQKHLPHTGNIARNFRNFFLAGLILERNALLLEPRAVHENSVFKFRKQIGLFYRQGKPAILHTGKFQELFDHAREPFCLAQDDQHAAPGLGL